MIEIRLLGQFQVQLNGLDVEIPSRPAQSLFAYLALNAGTAQRRERLAGLLWPESDEANARRNLRQALWHCRKGLGSSADTILLADDIHITFNGDTPYWLDTAVLQGNHQTEWDTRALLAAVQLYRGELLPGFYHQWVMLERERPLHTLIAHTSIVPGAAFSPDGQLLATASFDGTIRVWEVAMGRELLVLTGHDGGVTSVTFSPDGTQLLSTGQDGTARLYILPIADLIDLAHTRLTRTWTEDECRRYLHLDRCP